MILNLALAGIFGDLFHAELSFAAFMALASSPFMFIYTSVYLMKMWISSK